MEEPKKSTIWSSTFIFNSWCIVFVFSDRHISALGSELIFFPIVHDRDKFSNREQSETNGNDENAMCDYSSEY